MSERWPGLALEDLDADPATQFAAWFEQARAAGIELPEAAALATVSADGAPSVRMVLVKGFANVEFRFYTNYTSRKGRELAASPRAALAFHWSALGRQVRVEGEAERMSREDSQRYAQSRPRGSQLSALASPQSEVVDSRATLEARVTELERELGEDATVPLAETWGGFALRTSSIEFWQQRDDRLHDRLRYRREREAWVIERLAP